MDERDEVDGYIEEIAAVGAIAVEDVESLRETKKSGGQLEKEFRDDDKSDSTNLRNVISSMTIPQKIKLALFGNGACRALLAIDPNRIVHMAVMKNPKIRAPEVEDFAKNTSCPEGILRAIAGNQLWMKSYRTKANLVVNPKTPSDISLKWLRYLNKDDLKRIARSKNLPQVVAITAKKRLAEEEG